MALQFLLPTKPHHFFELSCERNPTNIAIVYDNQLITYAELNERANKLAQFLACLGIGRGSRVGILLDRSVNIYVVILAIPKVGATWVPLDPSWPRERLSFISKDAELSAIVTTSSLVDLLSPPSTSGYLVIPIDKLADDIARQQNLSPSPENEGVRDVGASISHIVYTSGTSGRPKGVAISNQNICNFLSVVAGIYDYKCTDRVYQGMTIAFDFSIEEIWVTFAAGATLVPGSSGAKYGPDLARFLVENKVTILACVPTLLATIDTDVPSLRLLLVGGEPCPQELVDRWARDGRRRMLNTYGPTETTVTALVAELKSGHPVTIGKPLPSYKVYLLDPEMRLVQSGDIGEICIGGPSVALGYLNNPELTSEKFVFDPFTNLVDESRLYKTGDLGRLSSNGEIEYLGRIDSQLKVRGYRVEPAEIESIILREPSVKSAAVTTWRPSENDAAELVAYIVLKQKKDEATFDISVLLEKLRAQLPQYMVPSFVELIDSLPVQASGKVDRSRLDPPRGPRRSTRGLPSSFSPPETELERIISKTWEHFLRMENVSVEDDFFLDLGGHSLLAARVVSELRKQNGLENLSISDLYEHPTIRALASSVDNYPVSKPSISKFNKDSPSPQLNEEKDQGIRDEKAQQSDRKFRGCGVAQMVSIYLYLMLFAIPFLPLQWTGIGFISSLSLVNDFTNPPLLAVGLISYVIFVTLVALALPIALKWILLGRTKPGRHPLWGSYFLRWWIVNKTQSLADFPLRLISGTPMMPIYFKLMGAKIGQNCEIQNTDIFNADLLEIGENTCIGVGTQIYCYKIQDKTLKLDRVKIGSRCYVGTNSVILPGGIMGDNSRLGDQSLLCTEEKIPEGESWSGSPSRRDLSPDTLIDTLASQEPESSSNARKLALISLHVIGIFAILVAEAVAFLPGILIMQYLYSRFGGFWFLLSAPLGGALFVLTCCTLISGMKYLLMPSVKPGVYSVHSLFGFRKWMMDALMDLSLFMNQAMYATLYIVPWLRSLGAKIEKRSEVSTISHITPNLLTVGPESFFADGACIGATPVYNGYLLVAPTQVGRRSFIGNSSCLTSNTSVADNCLVGVLSINPRTQMKEGTSWLGSPPINLPRREASPQFPETLTFMPSKKLVRLRLLSEFFRTIVPATIWLAATAFLIVSMIRLYQLSSYWTALLAFPALYLFSAILATLFVIAIKKILVQKYKPLVRPLWSPWVRKTELVTGLYENVSGPMLLDFLLGTPFAALVLRLFGTKIGKRVYIDTDDITEFDLVSVGDEAEIGPDVSLQTHLFEDRVMKTSNVNIGSRCSIGPRSIVLYDSKMEDNSELDGLSLLMKGETLRAGLRWQGSPARSKPIENVVTVP